MRSAHQLDSPRDNWADTAACRHNPDAWSAQSWTRRGHAAHVCRHHCPVLRDCLRDLADTPRDRLMGMVVAGVAHGNQGRPIKWPIAEVRCGVCRGR